MKASNKTIFINVLGDVMNALTLGMIILFAHGEVEKNNNEEIRSQYETLLWEESNKVPFMLLEDKCHDDACIYKIR